MLKNSLYRLGALMYDGDNPSFNRKTTIRKVIESYFYLNENHIIDCIELPTKIKEMFDIEIHIDEVRKIIRNNDKFDLTNGSCGSRNHDKCNVSIKLTDKRYQVVKEREDAGSIYRFIEEYYDSTDDLAKELTKEEFTSLIEKFLYTIFVQNMEKSSKMFDIRFDNQSILEDLEISEEHKLLINDFLDYDSDDKNKAIFDIGSLALEFVILNGNIDIQNQESNILRKVLYLDTNIIFRMMGINGEQRKKRVRTLIKRCIETGQEVRISYASQKEFFDSVKRHLSKVEGYQTPIHYTEPIKDSIIKSYFDSNSGNTKF